MANLNHDEVQCSSEKWITQQQQDLDELLNALNLNHDNEKLHNLIEKAIKHLQQHHENRAQLALKDATSFFSPSCCTSFENFFFWLGGCLPSMSIKLVYSLSGVDFDDQFAKFHQVSERKLLNNNFKEITAEQLGLINSLHSKTITEEEKLSSQMGVLQEKITSEPLDDIMTAEFCNQLGESSSSSSSNRNELSVDKFMDAHMLALAKMLSEADKLRLDTLKELLFNILTPLQAVDLLVEIKEFHISMNVCGKIREGSNNLKISKRGFF